MKALGKTQWSVDKTIGLMIDAVLSYGDLQQLRTALSLEYSAEHDRCMHPSWVTSPHDLYVDEDDDEKKVRVVRPKIVRLPEPIPPVELIRKRFKEFEGSLKIKVSDDGKIATHRFLDRLVGLHEEHKTLGLIGPGCGGSKEFRHWVTYCMDAFPVEAISVEHGGVFSSSLVVPSQSEEFFRIIMAATIKETNSELNRMHNLRGIARDFNSVATTGMAKGTDKQPIHFQLFICADKKALENLRGCSPGSPWCTCGKVERLAAAWPLSQPAPTSWSEAEARLNKVCTGVFPKMHDMYAWAHLAVPGEAIPRHCSVCKRKPYATKQEYEDDLERVKQMRADQSKEGRAAWQKKRLGHGHSHNGQYLHEASNLLFHMDTVIPEIMHLDALNVAKQAWTKGALVLLNEHMRTALTGYFKGLGASLAVKTKPDGRAGSAWFKASQWAELVHGSDKIPGGLTPWFASLLFHVAADHVSKQTAFIPQQAAANASSDVVMRQAFGLKGSQLLDCARLFDAYRAWHDATHLATPEDSDRERVALKLAITANTMMVHFKTVAKETGKTWVYHIALYIVPRTVRK